MQYFKAYLEILRNKKKMVVNMAVQMTESSKFEYNNIDVFFILLTNILNESEHSTAAQSCASLHCAVSRCAVLKSCTERRCAVRRCSSWRGAGNLTAQHHNACVLSSKRRGAVLRCAEKLLLQHSATSRHAALN